MYKDIGQRKGCSWVLEESMGIYLLRESNYWNQNVDGATSTQWRKTGFYKRVKNIN